MGTAQWRRDHREGFNFDKEEKYEQICFEAREGCPTLKYYVVKKIISYFAPEFVDSLFEFRPCARKLMYIGFRDDDMTDEERDEYNKKETFFKLGDVYESVEFNGAVYKLKTYDKVIGCAYFDWMEI